VTTSYGGTLPQEDFAKRGRERGKNNHRAHLKKKFRKRNAWETTPEQNGLGAVTTDTDQKYSAQQKLNCSKKRVSRKPRGPGKGAAERMFKQGQRAMKTVGPLHSGKVFQKKGNKPRKSGKQAAISCPLQLLIFAKKRMTNGEEGNALGEGRKRGKGKRPSRGRKRRVRTLRHVANPAGRKGTNDV